MTNEQLEISCSFIFTKINKTSEFRCYTIKSRNLNEERLINMQRKKLMKYAKSKFLGIRHNHDDSYDLFFKVRQSEVRYQLASFHDMEELLALSKIQKRNWSKKQIIQTFIDYCQQNGETLGDDLGLSDSPASWRQVIKENNYYELMTAETLDLVLTKDISKNRTIMSMINQIRTIYKDMSISLHESIADQTLRIKVFELKYSKTWLELVIDYQDLPNSHITECRESITGQHGGMMVTHLFWYIESMTRAKQLITA